MTASETAPAAFPDTYAELDTATLLHTYEAGPPRLRRALEGLAADALTAHPIPGKWSMLEIALHVTDSELVGAVRMRMVLGGDDPLLPGYDQDRWSRDLAYRGSLGRLEGALALFASVRAATLPLLAGAPAEDWPRAGRHPELGPVTLRNLLELYADHSERHIAQILERRALLGAPVDLAPLLPKRLY